jgi:hypothetical protein
MFKNCRNSNCRMFLSTSSDSCWISSVMLKQCPFKLVFMFGNKKVRRFEVGWVGRMCEHHHPSFCEKRMHEQGEVRGVLSWWRKHLLLLHWCGIFLCMSSYNHPKSFDRILDSQSGLAAQIPYERSLPHRKNYDYAVLIGPCLMSFFQLLGTRALLPWWLLFFLRIVTINPRYISCDNLQLKVPVCFQLSGLFLAGINSVLLLFLTHKMWDKLHSSLLHVQVFCQNPLVAAIVEVRMVY